MIRALQRADLLPCINFIFSRAGCEAAVEQCLHAGLQLTTPAERVEIRNIRRDGLEAIRKKEKSGEISNDESHREQESLEKLTHKWTDEVDRVGASKEQEVLEV